MKQLLVIIDVQKDFVDGSLGSAEAAAIIPGVCDLILSRDWDSIIATLDTHSGDYLSSREGQKLPVEHCIKGTPGWELDKKVEETLQKASGKGIMVLKVEKPTFGRHDLAEWLETALRSRDGSIQDGIPEGTQVFVCGLCTDICVISNALILKSALYDKADISVVKDCCAGTSPERHKAALDSMSSCQINVI